MEEVPALGRITVDREALETVARLTALAVPGVARIAPVPRSRLLGGKEGVRVTLQDGPVLVDLYLVVESGHNMLALGRQGPGRGHPGHPGDGRAGGRSRQRLHRGRGPCAPITGGQGLSRPAGQPSGLPLPFGRSGEGSPTRAPSLCRLFTK